MQIRGGSSKGLFFLASDVPENEGDRTQLILSAMEGVTSGDPRQIDGLGGATSLTSKVAIVSPSSHPQADLDYFFIQVQVGKGQVSTTQTCGNILAGVLPFAIEAGIWPAQSPTTTARIRLVNTGAFCEVIVETPDNRVQYEGNYKIDGVQGSASPIICNYLDTEGSTCGALLPTGKAMDVIGGIEATCIDNGMPLVVIRAADLGLTGRENIADLEANEALKHTIENIRLEAGLKMNLGNVIEQSIPKMCLISAPKEGGLVNTRMFIPHTVHEAIGVLAAVSVATACIQPGTVAEGIAVVDKDNSFFSVEHPSGEFTVNLDYHFNLGRLQILRSGVLRTARLLSKGLVYTR